MGGPGSGSGSSAGVPRQLSRAGVTRREAEVLAAVAERLRNREIAQRLHVSVRTVESHIAALLRKLAVPDRAALIALGAEIARATAGAPPARAADQLRRPAAGIRAGHRAA